MPTPQSILNDPRFTLLFFAVLIHKLGGDATITQADIDAVAYRYLDETGETDGSASLRLRDRTAN